MDGAVVQSLRPLLRQTYVAKHAFSIFRQTRTELPNLSVSEGDDVNKVSNEAMELIRGGRWQLCNDGSAVQRHFKFKTFKSTWDFMNEIAAECKSQKHHPEWTNVFNRTHIRWTTHVPKGLSLKDLQMARFCDQAAARHGEQWPDPQSMRMEGGRVVSDDQGGCGCTEG